MYSFDLRPLIWFGFVVMALLWGAWEAVDYFFVDEVIISKTILTPELEITVKDNVIDTIYIYRTR